MLKDLKFNMTPEITLMMHLRTPVRCVLEAGKNLQPIGTLVISLSLLAGNEKNIRKSKGDVG